MAINMDEFWEPPKDNQQIMDEETIRKLKVDNLALCDKLDQAIQDRYDALSVYSTDGLLSSEWILRTGIAERQRNELRVEVDKLKRSLIVAEDCLIHSTKEDLYTEVKDLKQEIAQACFLLNRIGLESTNTLPFDVCFDVTLFLDKHMPKDSNG